MPKDAPRWTLDELVDFEAALAEGRVAPPDTVTAVREAAAGLDGAAARRSGLKVWLEAVETRGTGAAFRSGLAMVSAGLCALGFAIGAGAVLGMLDADRGGLHVALFVAVLIGGQWLVLAMAALAWLARRRAADRFSLIQTLIARMAARLAGGTISAWWSRLVAADSTGRPALCWRIARSAQAAGIGFNLGIIAALGGLVLVRNVGFFWETTTEVAMHELLEKSCAWLAMPWSAWWPQAVPDAAVIEASRWLPGREAAPAPAAWWRFLLAATVVWGLLPRVLLWIMAWRGEQRSLAAMDFQARHHRALWRELNGAGRIDADDRPLDGVLVLDVGGSGVSPEALRPFLLRRLRVHPAGWHPVSVLDAGAEEVAAAAIAKAPAGVVFLSEGWALSPARMTALHAKVRKSAGPGVPLRFLVVNAGPDGRPMPPSAGEIREWERFTDSLGDPDLEAIGYHEDPS